MKLSSTELDRRLAELATDRKQDLARLLAHCGWTERELTERLGKSQSWVHRQVVYGRFLEAMPMPKGIKIPEKVFRTFWEQTRGTDESVRMKETVRLIEDHGTNHTAKRSKDLADKIVARFADGRWHPRDSIATKLEVSEALIEASVRTVGRAPYHAKVEQKQVGLKVHYRFFHGEKSIFLSEIEEKFVPILKELQEEGGKHPARYAPATVKHGATTLLRIIEDWAKTGRAATV